MPNTPCCTSLLIQETVISSQTACYSWLAARAAPKRRKWHGLCWGRPSNAPVRGGDATAAQQKSPPFWPTADTGPGDALPLGQTHPASVWYGLPASSLPSAVHPSILDELGSPYPGGKGSAQYCVVGEIEGQGHPGVHAPLAWMPAAACGGTPTHQGGMGSGSSSRLPSLKREPHQGLQTACASSHAGVVW